MTVLTHRGEGAAFSYAGQPMHILTGQDGLPPGFAAMELTVPPRFAGPMREIGAALSPDTPPDPERMRDIYARHASRLLP